MSVVLLGEGNGRWTGQRGGVCCALVRKKWVGDSAEGGCLSCSCEKEVGDGQGRGGICCAIVRRKWAVDRAEGGCLLFSCEKEVGGGQDRGGMSVVLL